MGRSIKNPKKSKRKNKASNRGESSSAPSVPTTPAKVWRPGVDTLDEGEELQFDPSAYNYLQAFSIGWPCLSFDIVRDLLGLVRTEFPHTLYGVAGTQAEQASWNHIGIFKLSNISGKKRDLLPSSTTGDDNDMDSDSSSDEDDDAADESELPVLQLHKVAHQGCINRIRSMPQRHHICATWADTGHVQIWDFSLLLKDLEESSADTNRGGNSILHFSPEIKFSGHKDEGYAIDWSPVLRGRLVSGDCKNCIHLWEPLSEAWNVDPKPFVWHAASVEDLQWSPTEANLFASCSADGYIAIWDVRAGKKPTASLKSHNTDVNVISWNCWMIASGGDDGTFLIHDYRFNKEEKGKGVLGLWAHCKYHKQPITSIEWSPHEHSTLAVTCADNQLTIWDLELKRDEEGEAEFKAKMKDQANAPEDLPAQLLFVHQGQKDLKELHWHPQIPGMLVSTGSDGFNVLMPANVGATLPSAGA